VLLRRLKSEVAKDLPDKIEQVVYCDLKPKQRDVYEALLSESRSAILDADGGRQRMLALTALLRLRQACCDLRLLGMEGVKDDEASVKAEALGELLDKAIEGGHRVLVFSQFVEMLQILVPDLAAKEVDFCYLDGSTRNRSEVVKLSGEGCPRFSYQFEGRRSRIEPDCGRYGDTRRSLVEPGGRSTGDGSSSPNRPGEYCDEL
jgi:SNF2 family DNA or RNA helicase